MPSRKGDGPFRSHRPRRQRSGNSPQEQLELVKNTAKHIVDMIADGVNVVVSPRQRPPGRHDQQRFITPPPTTARPRRCLSRGRRYASGPHRLPARPVCEAILNDLKARGIDRPSPTSPDRGTPRIRRSRTTSPVGAFMTEEEAEAPPLRPADLQGGRRPRLASGRRPRSPSASRRVRTP